jgi:hypothetical protein
VHAEEDNRAACSLPCRFCNAWGLVKTLAAFGYMRIAAQHLVRSRHFSRFGSGWIPAAMVVRQVKGSSMTPISNPWQDRRACVHRLQLTGAC